MSKLKNRFMKKILRNISFDDVKTLYEIASHCADEIDNPEILLDAAESLRLAIETQDTKLVEKARKQIVLFFMSDQGEFAKDSIFNVAREADDILFGDEDFDNK